MKKLRDIVEDNKLFRYREFSPGKLIGTSNLEGRIKTAAGINTYKKFFNKSRRNQYIKQHLGYYHPTLTVARQLYKGYNKKDANGVKGGVSGAIHAAVPKLAGLARIPTPGEYINKMKNRLIRSTGMGSLIHSTTVASKRPRIAAKVKPGTSADEFLGGKW